MPKRIADGQNPLADLDQGGVAQLDERQVLGLDLEEGQVGLRVGPDDLGIIVLALEGRHRVLYGVLGDVVVGQDVAVGADEEARPLDGAPVFFIPRRGPVEEAVPEIIERPLVVGSLLAGLLLVLADDLDHGRSDLLRDLDEVEVRPDLRR